MINYETILSLFDDKLTLLEYLTKIEKALKDSTLTEITIEQPTETTAVFTFVFENGDTIVTPSVTLPRGEKGDTGDKGDKGDKGDTGEAGADGVSVTSAEINASNHLIITLSNGNTIDAGEIAGIKILDIGSFTISASQSGGKIGDTTITTAQRDILVASYNYILKTTITVAGSSTGTAFYLYRTSGNVYKTLGTTDRYYVNISVNSDTQSLWYDQGTVQDKNIIAPNATAGQVLTADGSGGASWQNASGGTTLNKYTYTITNSNASRLRLVHILQQAKFIYKIYDGASIYNWVEYLGGISLTGVGSDRDGVYISNYYINQTSGANASTPTLFTITTASTTRADIIWYGTMQIIYYNDTEILS